jgi:peptide/nickel transport system substrate-binding protein
MGATESTLRIVLGGAKDDLWISNTPLGASNRAIGASLWGLAETLTKVSPRGELVPWLAQGVHNLDPLTWRIELRPDAQFWDGTHVTAATVAESLREAVHRQRDAELLLSPTAQPDVVSETTLDLHTTEPIGHIAHALSHPQLAIQRGGGLVMTGPYRPIEFENDQCLTLERFDAHWAGRPPLRRIEVRVLPNLADRINALLADEADVFYGFPPESVDQLGRFDESYAISSVPTVRLVYMQFNCGQPPFDDQTVRAATTLAIDRARLVSDVLHGHGAVATSFVPSFMVEDEQPIQESDPAAACRLLDALGWREGPDGRRVKDGARLAFDLLTPEEPVLAVMPLAQGVARQLRELGYEVRVREEPLAEFHKARDTGVAASMSASIAMLTGDPWFLMRVRLGSDARANPGTYSSGRFDRELSSMARTVDPGERRASWQRLQAILAKDAPRLLLVFLPNIVITRGGRIANLPADPNNQYFIDTRVSVIQNGRHSHS